MAALNAITPTQLSRLIGTPRAPVLIDIRTDADFSDDPRLIPGSIRCPHTELDAMSRLIGDDPCVIICHKGKKLSQGVASWLRGMGKNAEHLEGGFEGWHEQREAPLVPQSILPARIDGSTLWVARQRPKIDRIACPWLIRRFVDRNARFLFVASEEVQGVVDHFGATPFDVPNTFWTHQDSGCTFDTMIRAFDLRTEALERMARIIRAADTDQNDLAPEAAGLLAFSVGLSRQYRDDHAQLEAGLHLYDALFRWARDGFDEKHDWPSGHGA